MRIVLAPPLGACRLCSVWRSGRRYPANRETHLSSTSTAAGATTAPSLQTFLIAGRQYAAGAHASQLTVSGGDTYTSECRSADIRSWVRGKGAGCRGALSSSAQSAHGGYAFVLIDSHAHV